MEVAALCVRLVKNVLVLLCALHQKVDSVSLHLSPNRVQFFPYQSLTFHCEGLSSSAGWKVVHRFKGEVLWCRSTSELTSTGLSCHIKTVVGDYNGEYWCEDGQGSRSNSINITVTFLSVILESPVLPVGEGDAVTLRCKAKMTFSRRSADFYKDGLLIGSSSTGEMTIHSVSKSDEGLYRCRIPRVGESSESWLSVKEYTAEYWRDKGEEASTESNSVISVTASFVTLESPVLPVREGDAVTLRCKTKSTSNLTADFYKDELLIGSSSTGEMAINSVSKSDEGLYKCRIPNVGESPESLLTVRAPQVETHPSSDYFSDHVFLTLRIIFSVVLMVMLFLLLLRLLLCGEFGANQHEPMSTQHEVNDKSANS